MSAIRYAFFLACGLTATPVLADMVVLVPDGTRTVLATSSDTLITGETIRAKFDKLFWFPGASQDEGHLFMHHELAAPDGGLCRLTYLDGAVTAIEDWVVGTQKNCSGTISSWGTILSCEEFPEDDLEVGHVVEVDPLTANTWTRCTAMGRFSHEAIIEDPLTGDLYMTEDMEDGVFFKFVADAPGDLSSGSLYAFRETTRDWVLLSEMVHTHNQAIALGATPRPSPEGLVYNPVDDKFYIAITGLEGSPDSGFGYIMRFDPRTNLMERWLDGSESTFANPDNLAVDSVGNLLVLEDKHSDNMVLTGPNRVILQPLTSAPTAIMVGLDNVGEPTGLEWGGSDDRFFLSWQGSSLHQMMEVHLPMGWNAPTATIPPASASPRRGPVLDVSPNPFTTTSRFRIALPGRGTAALGIYDVRGRLVRRLFHGPVAGPDRVVSWDGRGEEGRIVQTGTYFARLRVGETVVSERIVRLR